MGKVTDPAILAKFQQQQAQSPMPQAPVPQPMPSQGLPPLGAPMRMDDPRVMSEQADAIRRQREDLGQQQVITAPLARENIQTNIDQGRSSIKSQDYDRAGRLRDDYQKDPIVSVYPTMAAVYASALETPPTTQGDHLLTVLATKLADPGTAAMQGEVESQQNTAPLIRQIQAQFGKQLQGQGGYTDIDRKQLRESLVELMRMRNMAYIARRVHYKDLAEKYGYSPDEIVGEHAGIPFQDVEKRFLGKESLTELDYRGKPVRESVDFSSQHGFTPVDEVTSGLQLSQDGMKAVPLPKEYQDAHAAWLREHPRGTLKASDYLNFRQELDAKYGGGGLSLDDTQDFVRDYNNPNLKVRIKVPGATVPMSSLEQIGNDIAQSPVGTALISGSLSASANLPLLLAGEDGREKVQLLETANPTSAFVGEVAGSALGAKGFSAVGGAAAKKAAPALLGGGSRAAVGREAARDISYGATASAADAEPGDRLQAAMMGGALGGTGTAGGTVLAKGVTPLLSDSSRAAVKELGATDLTLMQRLGKGSARMEETVQGFPVVRGARAAAEESMNIAYANRQLAKVGKVLPKNIEPGTATIAATGDMISDVYDEVLPNMSGNNRSVRFQSRVASAANDYPEAVKAQPDKAASALAELQRAFDAQGNFNGETLKKASTQLQRLAISWGKNEDPYIQDIGHLAGDYLEQLHNLAARQNPRLAPKLAAADQAWAGLIRMERAGVAAAANGGVYSPAQLANAMKTSSGAIRKRDVARGKGLDQPFIAAANDILGKATPRDPSVYQVGAAGATGREAMALALLPLLTAQYAPGVKRITQALLTKERPGSVQKASILGAAVLQALNSKKEQ